MKTIQKLEILPILMKEFPNLKVGYIKVNKDSIMTYEELIESIKCIRRKEMVQHASNLIRITNHEPFTKFIGYSITPPDQERRIEFRVDYNPEHGRIGSLLMYNALDQAETQVELVGLRMAEKWR